MDDEIDSIQEKPDACGAKTPHDYQLMFKTLENPLRKKIVRVPYAIEDDHHQLYIYHLNNNHVRRRNASMPKAIGLFPLR